MTLDGTNTIVQGNQVDGAPNWFVQPGTDKENEYVPFFICLFDTKSNVAICSSSIRQPSSYLKLAT